MFEQVVPHGAGRGAPSTGSGSWSWAERHPVAARLDGTGPSPELVAALVRLEPADLDDTALIEAMAAWERVVAWSVATQAVIVAELTRRPRPSGVESVADEVAARLAVSRRSGENKVQLARGLDAATAVHDALFAGDLDVRKADLLLRETEHLAPSVAHAVQVAVLPEAPGLTVPQLRSAIRRLEIRVDPAAAEARLRSAREQRCIRLRPAPDAMAWVTAFLPAPDAMAVMTAVDALAAACAPEDQRGVDARRADALVDAMSYVLDTGTGPYGPLPSNQHRHPHLSVSVAASTLAGDDERPGELRGYGPVPASVVRDVAERAAWRAVAADPSTGEAAARSANTYRPSAALVGLVTDRDVTCTFPGCRVPALRCDIDHIVPFDARESARGRTTADNLQALCRHHHRLKTHAPWTVHRDPASGVTTWHAPTGHTYTRDPVLLDPEDLLPVRRARPTVEANPDVGALPGSVLPWPSPGAARQERPDTGARHPRPDEPPF